MQKHIFRVFFIPKKYVIRVLFVLFSMDEPDTPLAIQVPPLPRVQGITCVSSYKYCTIVVIVCLPITLTLTEEESGI